MSEKFKNSVDESWMHAINECFMYGSYSEPRGKLIKEQICFKSIIDMNQPVLLNKERGLSYRFMCGEAAWILSGDNKLETISKYNKVIQNFSDDGIYLKGAYGPPIVEQLSYIIDALNNDKDTRQAVLTTWRQNPRASKDIACTISIQFLIRDGKLHVIDNMRSSDLWLGWPYDVFTFSMLARYVLCHLNNKELDLGNIYLCAGSSHLYSEHWVKAQELIMKYLYDELGGATYYDAPTIPEFKKSSDLIDWLKDKADNNSLIIKQ